MFSSPLWGFLYLILSKEIKKINRNQFSSPLWGFFYLINSCNVLQIVRMVLVPSLGILLFNGYYEKQRKKK